VAFGTKIDEIVISGLAMAIGRITGQTKLAVMLESHGREDLHKSISVDRTVGWFTSMYPVVFDCCKDIRRNVISAKEAMRNIRSGGISYSYADCAWIAEPDICFNYLGDFSGMTSGASYSVGETVAKENGLVSAININGIVRDGRLSFTITCDAGRFGTAFAERLAEEFMICVCATAEFCTEAATEKTASDYGLYDLTMTEFEKLAKGIDGEAEKIYGLTPLQQGMLYHKLEDSGSTSYMIQEAFDISGKMDTRAFGEVLRLLAQRYEVPRTSIVYKQVSEPKQAIIKGRIPEYREINLAMFTKEEQVERYTSIVAEDLERGFDLQEDTLVRATCVIMGESNCKLLWSFHHIILDGWCTDLIIDKFVEYYEKLAGGISAEIIERQITEERNGKGEYSDYIKWLESKEEGESLRYWEEMLDGYEDICEIMPMMPPEPCAEQMRRIGKTLGKELSEKLLSVASANNVTISTLAETAFGILLQKYSNTDDVVFGKVVSGRNADIKGIDRIVGLFVNTIPIRVTSNPDIVISGLLRKQQEQWAESSKNDFCSLAMIQAATTQGPELIKVLFVFENYTSGKADNHQTRSGLSIEVTQEQWREQTNYSLSVSSHIDDGILNYDVMYNPNEYREEEIKLLLRRFEKIFEEIGGNPEKQVSMIECITEEERHLILGEFNNTHTNYPSEMTVAQLFEEQVARTPDNVAVVYKDKSLTYHELNEKANALAYKLRMMGIRADDFVAIIAERGIEMIAGIYGVVKAGGAYVPIDPSYPEERIGFMLDDCSPKVVLKYNAVIETGFPIIDIGEPEAWEGAIENPKNINKPEDLIYCTYTSGTTGNPKGVMIENRGAVNMMSFFKNTFAISPDDRVLQFANSIFDASISEILMSLLTGATLVCIPSVIVTEPELFNSYCMRHGVTVVTLPPNYYINNDINIEVRLLITAGSEASTLMLQKVEKGRYVNAYGPTENSVIASYWEKPPGWNGKNVPIGCPIANTRIYIMKGGALCGIGIPGELCIAGTGLARGYLNQPILTAEKFIDNPYGVGKLYKTGDLARWLPDGNIEYLGRIDEQVKIRGIRVELGEIECAIRAIDGIKDTAVIAREDASGDKALYAFFASEEDISVSSIRSRLVKTLPGHMIPAYMAQVETIPVTQSGKLDKRALPEIEKKAEVEYIAPRSETEEKICQVFSEFIGIEKISIVDNYFDYGLNSMWLMRILSALNSVGIVVPFQSVYNNLTIMSLVDSLNNDNSLIDIRKEDYSNYDNILSGNIWSENIEIKKRNLGTIILTGANGFLAMHILDEIMKNYQFNEIYCFVRAKTTEMAYRRFENSLNCYFNGKYISMLKDRIFVIPVDITDAESVHECTKLRPDTIFHIAANTNHYGFYSEFYGANVEGTRNICELAELTGAFLVHISTLSVCPYFETDIEYKTFSERDYYKGQGFDNVYVATKFLAEGVVLNYLLKNKGIIIRTGAISNRYHDAKPTRGYENNQMLRNLRTLIQVHFVPESLLTSSLQMDAVDDVAAGVVMLAENYSEDTNVFHLFNEDEITIPDILEAFELCGYGTEVISDISAANMAELEKAYGDRAGKVFDHQVMLKAENHYPVSYDNGFTRQFTSVFGYKARKLDTEYMVRVIKHLDEYGFWQS